MHVDRVEVARVHRARDLQLGADPDVHPVQVLTPEVGDRRLPGDLQTERHHVQRTGLHLEGTTQTLLGEDDVLLVLLVAALDLDPRLQPDGQPLDLLLHGSTLDPNLALDDSAGHDVRLGDDRVHRSTTGAQAREQLLEAHALTPLERIWRLRRDYPVPTRNLRPRFQVDAFHYARPDERAT